MHSGYPHHEKVNVTSYRSKAALGHFVLSATSMQTIQHANHSGQGEPVKSQQVPSCHQHPPRHWAVCDMAPMVFCECEVWKANGGSLMFFGSGGSFPQQKTTSQFCSKKSTLVRDFFYIDLLSKK